MNGFGKVLLLCSGLLLFLIGCSELKSAGVSFTKQTAPPGNSMEGLPQQVTPSPGCQGAITVRLIYNVPNPNGSVLGNLVNSDMSLASCQEIQFQNGSYTIKESIACSGGIFAGNSTISFSGVGHDCNGNINLAQAGKTNLTCSGSLYGRMETEYAFRLAAGGQVANGVNVIGQLCQRSASNRSPTIVHPGSPVNKEGDSVNLKISASDPDGDALTFSATGLPPGLSINGSNGVISGTVSANSAKSYPVTVSVRDNKTTPAVATFVWIITSNSTTGQMAFVTSVTPSASGAILTLSGAVLGLRYQFDSSGGYLNLSGPFGSQYTINKVWPQGTTYVCVQAQGVDGSWRGNNANEQAACNAVTVGAPPKKTATVAWDRVTTNADGTPCNDLAGYIIYYSDVNGDWRRFPSKIVNAPSTSGEIPNLEVGKTYFFAVSAFDTSNMESQKSQTLSYTIPK